jgi:DNA-binding transcriptional ArsR family regulator
MAHDLEQPASAAPRVLFSPILELILASNLLPSRDPFLSGFEPDWKRRQQEELPAEAKAYLEFTADALDWVTLSLCDYLPITGQYDDWSRFSAHVLSEPIDDFLSVVLNHDIPFEELEGLRRRPERAAAWIDRMSCFSRMRPDAAVRIFAKPEDFRTQLLAFVAGNRTAAFEARVKEFRPRYEAQMATMRERLRGKDPIVVAEELTKKPFRYPRNFHSYTFAPSHFLGRKPMYAWGEGNFLLAFGLLLTEEQPSERSRELSDRMKVLGDRTRLDILRLLSEGPSYGKAIAERLNLTTATVSRQLDQLKEAGLVMEERADANNVKQVHLRTEAVNELFGQIEGFLGISRA